MISHTHKCIFVHIPKTAGTSIEKKLGHFETLERSVQDHRSIRELEPFALHHLKSIPSRYDSYFLKHIRNNFRGQPSPSRHQYDSYFKFTIVRNTWSRIFSWYRNVMRDEHHRQNRNITSDLDLKSFLMHCPDDWPLRSQLYWIQDSRGQVAMDFIGRFENLANDFKHIGETLGLPDPELPQLIAGDGTKYVDSYTPDTIDWVRNRYAEEIEFFGFEFGE